MKLIKTYAKPKTLSMTCNTKSEFLDRSVQNYVFTFEVHSTLSQQTPCTFKLASHGKCMDAHLHNVYAYAQTYILAYIHTHFYIIHIYIQYTRPTYIHTYIQLYKHTYTHTYIQLLKTYFLSGLSWERL